jgi:NAD(P)-dependent dehydrogenase (short-subunit alcohol dehydrogenase family)
MLTDRIALVTGASRGLGRAIAAAFVDAGASVALVARPSSDLDAAAAALRGRASGTGQQVLTLPADLGRPDHAGDLVTRVLDRFGRLDVLVNNAGMTGPVGALDTCDWDDWTSTLAVNLLAPVALMRAAVRPMRAQGRGKIINISGGGATGPRVNFSAYAAAKSALVRVTETLAAELAGTGIDVNAVAPGAMNTRMLSDVLSAGPEKAGGDAWRKALEQQASGGDSPERAAALVLFLASPESDGITSRLLSAVWDPWESLAARREELARSDIYTLRRIVPEDRGKDWAVGR